MSWIIACKQYQKQRGDGAKYIVPKKGSSEYEEVKKIFDSLEKAPKKEKVKPEKKPKKEPVPVPKKEIKQEDSIRTVIRNELIQQIREQGLESLTVEVV
jgi:hypothetical protein